MMSRLFLLLSVLFVTANAFAEEQPFLGHFTTVSESECNSEITLMFDGTGIFVDTCRIEDGTHINSNKVFNITWKKNNDLIIVDIDGTTEAFIYHEKLSCKPFAKTGHSNGLVGYGTQFWRYPVECK